MTDFAVGMFPTDYSMPPGDVAKAAEERGFESLWFSEHTNIPTSRDTPYPLGGEMPEQYWHTLDPYVAMTAAAMATTKLKVASGIALAAYRDPIILAKTIASLDMLSNGRVILGIGGGWCREEMANHGVAYEDRWKILRENILAMREIWTKDEPEFHGEFVDFDPLWSWPKPVQPGGPPILLGVLEGTRQFGRVVEYCDGWVPVAPAVYTSFGEDAVRTGRQQMDKMRGRCPEAPRAGRGRRPLLGRNQPDGLRRWRGLQPGNRGAAARCGGRGPRADRHRVRPARVHPASSRGRMRFCRQWTAMPNWRRGYRSSSVAAAIARRFRRSRLSPCGPESALPGGGAPGAATRRGARAAE